MKKPYVICHMMSSVDGRIITANWGNQERWKNYSEVYNQVHESYGSQGWMCGRVTMEKDFSEGRLPELLPVDVPVARAAYIADHDATSFAVAIDPHGKLGWPGPELGGDHLICVLTKNVTDEYIYYLQRIGVSYIFAGKDEIDFKVALYQLADLFRIKKLMLEGGGNVNGTLLAAGLVDELSLLITPLADGTDGAASTFDVSPKLARDKASRMSLKEVKQLDHDLVHLTYLFNH